MDKKPNLISILTLNRLELTKKTTDSILENSFEDNTKIIFFDNGSTDGTLEYLNKVQKKYYKTVKYLKSDNNIGVAGGRNRVFRYAINTYGTNFNWILSLDNDCIVHERYDSALTNCIEEEKALAVCPKLIQPNGKIFHNAHDGFLINLNEMQLRLEYGENVNISSTDERVSKRLQTDVILGTSAKTPEFFNKVGFYDEGHKIGWEDYSLALRAFGLKKEDFLRWKKGKKHNGKEWIPLKKIIEGEKNEKKALVIYEPACIITHDHPVTEGYEEYEKIRWKAKTIQESTDHFIEIWGVKPLV